MMVLRVRYSCGDGSARKKFSVLTDPLGCMSRLSYFVLAAIVGATTLVYACL